MPGKHGSCLCQPATLLHYILQCLFFKLTQHAIYPLNFIHIFRIHLELYLVEFERVIHSASCTETCSPKTHSALQKGYRSYRLLLIIMPTTLSQIFCFLTLGMLCLYSKFMCLGKMFKFFFNNNIFLFLIADPFTEFDITSLLQQLLAQSYLPKLCNLIQFLCFITAIQSVFARNGQCNLISVFNFTSSIHHSHVCDTTWIGHPHSNLHVPQSRLQRQTLPCYVL